MEEAHVQQWTSVAEREREIASMSTQMPGTTREEGTSVCIVEPPRQKPILIPESPVSMSPRPKCVSYPPESEGLHRLHLYPGTNTYSPRSRSSRGVNASASQIDIADSPRRHRCAKEEYVDNVESTARVLRASVSSAEARCRELAARNGQLVDERARAERQIQKLRRALRDSSAAVKMEPSVSVSTEPEHRKSQKDAVVAVQSKLSIIEDLYRNCFYETVRQDAVIELLRKALTEVRETENGRVKGKTRSPWGSKHGSDKGVRQQWDTDACHNILADVDNLKIEISNYISNSNNDSGMWERGGSEASSQGGGVSDELHGILTQLSQLRLLLTDDFGSCGCSDNQMTLKKENEDLRAEAACLQCKINQLESSMSEKEKLLLRYEQVIEGHSHELTKVRQELAQAGDKAKEWEANCQRKHAEIQNLNAKIQELQALLDTKSGALEDAQAQCKAQEDTIQGLREQLEHSAQQSSTVRGAAHGVAEAARCGAERARAAAQHYRRLQHAHKTLQEKYRARLQQSRELGAALAAARRAGAALCRRSRSALRETRERAGRLADNHRMQEAIIKSKDQQIERLREQLRNQSDSERTSVNEMPCCSKSRSDEDRKCASARETASRHTPPPPCGDDRCPYWRCCERGSSSVPLAHGRAVSLCRRPDTCCLNTSVHAQFSPRVSLIEGMSQLQEALTSSQKRWQRRDGNQRR